MTAPTTPHEPKMIGEDTMRLLGVGPDCPGCGGPTHSVTGNTDAERPWYCVSCSVRLDSQGQFGSAADFPAGVTAETEASDE